MKKGSRTKFSVINVITGMAGQLVIIIMSFITRTVFINTLGKTYLGINGLFSDILSMLSLTELGLDTAMNFKLYKPLASNDTPRLQVLLKFYKLAYRVIGFTFVGIGIILIPFLPALIKDYDSLATLGINAPFIFCLYLLQSATSYLFSASKAAIIKADQKIYISTTVGIAITIFKNVTQVIALYIFEDFVIYTAIAILYGIAQNLIIAQIAKKMYPQVFFKTENKLSLDEVKDTFKDLGALFIYKVNSVVIKATDNIVLSSCIGLTIVGLYSNYLLFYTTINSFMSRIYAAIKASMGNLFATSEIEKQYSFFEVMNFVSILTYGTAAIGVACCSNELINCWLGNEYVIPQPLSILIGFEILFAGIKMNLGQIRNVTGLYRQMWYRPLIGILINITVSFSLVFWIGIYGVIIGTISSDVIANFLIDPKVIHRYYFKNYKPSRQYYSKNLKYFSLLIAIGFVDYLCCNFLFIGHGIISVATHIILCAITAPVIILFCYRNSQEGKYIITLIRRLVKKIHFIG